MPCVQAPELVAAKYRAQGRRLTPQRQLIFSLLHDNATHPTADALFAVASKRMPGISLRTVYQTLDELSEMGEIQLMRCDGGALRFDPNVDDHHHALDAATGEVFDVYVDNLDALRAQLPEGFEVENVSIVFHGRVAKGNSARSTSSTKSPARQQTGRAKSTKRAPRRTSRGSSQ
ncbi:MAG: transcriptional repressor [Actinobacteria bacterium]|nr:transcriptional repressor [Actinomycetota bacterium]NBP17472.1 transcriptional repressor [Actinomycetota bacterium]